MRRVIVESPYAGATPEDIERNLRFLRCCMADCFERGEAPYASHALYTQPGVLDDKDPNERTLGIEAGFAWKDVAHATVVYTNLGISTGMSYGIEAAKKRDTLIEFRRLHDDWETDTSDLATSRWGR